MPSDDIQFVVEMFPARHGDAFLVRIARNGRRTNILIDAGPHATYHDAIRPRLMELAAGGESLRAFIVTHIDGDHIEGAIAFLEENGPSCAPSIIEVREVWHNSYRHLFTGGIAPTPEQVARVKTQMSSPNVQDAGDISARQGSTLATLLRRHAYLWNAAFDGGAAATNLGPRRLLLEDGIALTLLSPRPVDLAALARLWRRELISLGVARDLVHAEAFEEAFERMLERESDIDEGAHSEVQVSARKFTNPPPPSEFQEDQSESNASSIAFLLDVAGKRALFLGDACPSTIAAQVRKLCAATPLDVAVMKISHHGSRKNTSPDLCSAIRADHALVSTNGRKHGHPDIESLLWLISSQPGITLHFNYSVPMAQAISAPELVERYGHRVVIAPPSSACVLSL